MFYEKKYKLVIFIFWLLVIFGSLSIYILNPDYFEPEVISSFLQKHAGSLLFVYSILSIVRGFTLIPSTPFIFAGAILFPSNLIAVLIISISGILISSTFIYYFSDFMEFNKFFIKKYPKKIVWVTEKLNRKEGFLFLVAWCFFPAVPTDLVCYVAGTIKMHYPK